MNSFEVEAKRAPFPFPIVRVPSMRAHEKGYRDSARQFC
jgi:hypothetical protein